MYLVENPVLQRELLVNLRMGRAFLLLLLYQSLLGAVVYFAWPQDQRLDLTQNPEDARNLVDLFFLGQYILASLMAPSFAAGSITGEKERKTYEMLLASPLRPAAIVLGKLVASLTHLAVLIFTSLPIVMLCLPLGGVSLYEVLAAYLALIASVLVSGMISVACSSYFQRTAASLVVSYLLILPLALLGVLCWTSLADQGQLRLLLAVTVLPGMAIAICIALFVNTSVRLLHPPDVGSEGQDVVDLEQEAQTAVGLVINRDQFPDKLFAPAKRNDLIEDGANPVYDKEIRSEIFSQGTLMLRLVIQVSMLLAIPLMAACLYIHPELSPWYLGYVVVFNMLVGPVFSAGSVTSERERQTLDLLLTTAITPLQILWGKLVAGLRVSSVLTMFLLWPVLLACVMVSFYWSNLLQVLAYLAIILLTCLTTATLALFCSVLCRKTAHALMISYLMIIVLFCVPLAIRFFSETFLPNLETTIVVRKVEEAVALNGTDLEAAARDLNQQGIEPRRASGWSPALITAVLERASTSRFVEWLGISSPFAAAFSVPLNTESIRTSETAVPERSWHAFGGYVLFTLAMNLALLSSMIWLFNVRWRVAD